MSQQIPFHHEPGPSEGIQLLVCHQNLKSQSLICKTCDNSSLILWIKFSFTLLLLRGRFAGQLKNGAKNHSWISAIHVWPGDNSLRTHGGPGGTLKIRNDWYVSVFFCAISRRPSSSSAFNQRGHFSRVYMCSFALMFGEINFQKCSPRGITQKSSVRSGGVGDKIRDLLSGSEDRTRQIEKNGQIIECNLIVFRGILSEWRKGSEHFAQWKSQHGSSRATHLMTTLRGPSVTAAIVNGFCWRLLESTTFILLTVNKFKEEPLSWMANRS